MSLRDREPREPGQRVPRHVQQRLGMTEHLRQVGGIGIAELVRHLDELVGQRVVQDRRDDLVGRRGLQIVDGGGDPLGRSVNAPSTLPTLRFFGNSPNAVGTSAGP